MSKRPPDRDHSYDDVDGLWTELEDVTAEFAVVNRRKDRQLNVRIDAELLASLRRAAELRGEGYHSLARRYIEQGVAQELGALELSEKDEPQAPFQLKEAMLVLVAAGGPTGKPNEPIDGRMRLQKLLFLLAQHLRPAVAARFEAYNFGPFDEAVSTDLQFLAGEGLIEPVGGATEIEVIPPGSDRGDRILEWIRGRGDRNDRKLESYRLTQRGLEWVERFFASDEFGTPDAKEKLASEAAQLKSRYGRMSLEDLVEHVYEEYPEFTTRSKIRHEVAERAARKRARATGQH